MHWAYILPNDRYTQYTIGPTASIEYIDQKYLKQHQHSFAQHRHVDSLSAPLQQSQYPVHNAADQVHSYVCTSLEAVYPMHIAEDQLSYLTHIMGDLVAPLAKHGTVTLLLNCEVAWTD